MSQDMQEVIEHMNDQLFRSAFEEFNNRSTHNKVFHLFVKEHTDDLDLTQVTSCVSVGAGEGGSDLLYINSSMPNLKTFYALEPNRESFRKLHQNISQMVPIGTLNNVSTHFYLTAFEDWGGPTEPVDLIILSQVLYYLDDHSSVIKKCAAWLKDGGRLWVINEDTNCLSYKLATQIFQGRGSTYTQNPYPEIAHEAGLQLHRESRIQYEVDYSNPTWEFLHFFVYSNTTQKDFEKFKESIAEYFKGSDEYIDKPHILSFMFIK